MRRWFLSYHSPDQALAERLKAALERKDADARVFFAPSSLRAGRFWSRALAEEIAQADAFVLLVGEKGVGDWQVLEYDEALEKRVKLPDFPVILVLLEGQTAPGLPFLRRLHWIVTADPGNSAVPSDDRRLAEADRQWFRWYFDFIEMPRGSPPLWLYPTKDGRVMAAAPLEQTFWETFCDLIGLEPELHDDEKSSTATKARVAAIIATEKFHDVPRWSPGIISCRCTYLESGAKPREGQDHVAVG
jgi:hypothetical protein